MEIVALMDDFGPLIEEIRLCLGLHALGHDIQLHVLGHRQYGFNQSGIIGIAGSILHK